MWFTTRRLPGFLTKVKGITVPISRNLRNMTTSTKAASDIEEQKIEVDGVNINYVRTGVGEHPVLLLPGAMGTIWTDFKPQIENLNKEKLTIVAWDPPGYGKSRPPEKTFPENFFRRDATWACNLMRALGYNKFSLLGWSDGGITALILAAHYPENVRKMIVTGANAYIAPQEMKIYEKIRDINTWSERMRAPLVAIYGEKYFQDVWSAWIDGMKRIYDNNGGDICKKDLVKIKCPTLIVHGAKDAMVLGEHPDHLKANIANSRMDIFENGAHNLHLRYADEFNSLANQFFTE
ncbi:valacyclovir hydrolase [Nasonia vitripennis]|uniref:AB hydrolase-1 domain-containing protein n=1 Tax=Nasonia vitripennis TaxID=7425 RepID=A0A7M7HCX3_NASVI|nr:valacyclovir hydrolase [Nasonia vitripennis]